MDGIPRNFDILLVRREDGFQIGVEAKLKLNGKIIVLVSEQIEHWRVTGSYSWRPFHPYLPRLEDRYDNHDWHECCPHRRLDVPDWVPDVGAGNSSPVMLTFWKIAAIKLAIVLEKRGFLRREDFKKLNVSMSRWTQGKWLVQNGTGGWIKGDYFPDFKRQHPTNYQQIEANYDK